MDKAISLKTALIQKLRPIKKTAVDIEFLTPKLSNEFKKNFTKVAMDMGCQYNEIYSMIQDLEREAH
jgi:hypothetical protein